MNWRIFQIALISSLPPATDLKLLFYNITISLPLLKFFMLNNQLLYETSCTICLARHFHALHYAAKLSNTKNTSQTQKTPFIYVLIGPPNVNETVILQLIVLAFYDSHSFSY